MYYIFYVDRDPAEGSVFISNFCDTLNDLGDTRDLTHIITAVNGKFDKNPVPFKDKIHTITAERRDHTSKLIQFKRSD